MTTLEYTIEKGSIYEYQLELLRSGKCKALLPGSYYVEGDNIRILCETSGTISLPEMLKSRDLELLSGFRSMLRALRRIIEASQLAEGYMIDNSKLSFAAGDIYFDADDGRAKLLLKPGQQSLVSSITALCGELGKRCPGVNAAVLSERLENEARRGTLGGERMLRLLSSWEFELADGPENSGLGR